MIATQTYSLLVIGGFLMAGYLIVRLPLISRAYLPGSLVAGFLLLLVGPQIGSHFRIGNSTRRFMNFGDNFKTTH
ncbi:MAG: hypothetical protein U0520_04940 [Candidatus Saccharimonadales bacterium]